MSESLPATTVVRLSPGSFDPSRIAEIDALATKQAEYLVPAIKQLPGLLSWYTGVSPDSSIVNISVRDSEEHAAQMGQLQETAIVARGDMQAVGVTFTPIVNYPIIWTI
jgi:hypothetical protein